MPKEAGSLEHKLLFAGYVATTYYVSSGLRQGWLTCLYDLHSEKSGRKVREGERGRERARENERLALKNSRYGLES